MTGLGEPFNPEVLAMVDLVLMLVNQSDGGYNSDRRTPSWGPSSLLIEMKIRFTVRI